jgi:diguanylate cyclase (GGDEF)-like protein/PAS domain S-box-containing protein
MGGIPGELLGAVRVLLVEDDRTTAMVIESHLGAITSVRCTTDVVSTLAQARERLATLRYDLVIADLHLPDSPAAETIASLTSACSHPIIALTLDESAELRRAALDSGAYDFLLKSQVTDGSLDRPVRLAALQARTLDSLRRSEARLRAMVNAEPECVKLLDAGGRLVDMNPAGLAMIEADTLERVRGHCVYDLVTSEHREAFRALVERGARGEAGSLVFEIVGLKGARRWMETRVVPLRDEASGETLVLGITRDITSQRQTEKALQESEERFRKLTDLSSDWYWEQDAEYRLTFMSTLLAQKTGLDAGAYLGRRRWDQPALNLTEADWARHREQLERHEPFRNFEMQRPAPGGTRWLSISGEPVFNAAGQFKGYRGVGRDITQQRQAEQRLRLEHAVNRVLAEAEDASAAVVGVLGAICEAEGWDCGRYFTLDAAANKVRLQEAWSVGTPEADRFIADSRHLELGPGVGLFGTVWQTGEPLWVEDAQKDSRSLLAPRGWARGAFICPVHSDGRMVGILGLTSRSARKPDPRLMDAVRVIARQVGQFVQRKQAEQVMRDSESRFRSLIELSSDFYWETDAEHRITRTTHADKHRPASEPVLGKTRWERPSIHPDAAGWAAHRATLEARQPFRDFEMGRVDPDGETRFLSVSGEPVYDGHGRFTGYRGVGREVTERRREERLVALEHAVSRYLAEAKTVSAALSAVMRAICEAENWECGRYFQLDEAANAMRCQETWASGSGPLARFAESSRGIAIAPGQGLIGHVWQTGEPVWSSDVSKDARSSTVTRVRDAGVHGAFIFPVTFEGRTVGVLSMSSSTVRRPDERLMRTMRVVGAQIGQFLQRKQAEVALAESETRFRQTFELAASGMAHVDLAGRFIDVNRKLCDMLGYTEAELLRCSVKDVSHPADRDTTDQQRALMRAGEVGSVQFEKRYLRKDGSTLWVNLTVALVRNGQSDPQYEIAVMEDITERKEREGTLQRFRTALDSSADMVFLFDLSAGRLLDFNQSACNMLGYTREELLKLRARDIRPAASSGTLKAETEELLGTAGRTNMVLTEYRRKDGSTFPVESRRSLLDTPQGRVLVVNSRDLTERTAAEKRRAVQARYQKKISKLGQAALSKRNSAELIAKAVQTVQEGLGAGVVAYIERSGSEAILRRVEGLGSTPSDSAVVRIAPGNPLAAVLEQSQPVVLNGPWPEPLPLPFEWMRRYGALAAVPVPADGGPRGIVCAFADAAHAFGPEETRFLGAAASMVSAALHRLDSEARLAYLAQFDPLTGLPNRALLADRFSLMIVQARRRNVSLGVLFIDLDDFKLVNDSQGHAAGDELLKLTAARLQDSLRDGDTVARISGDEFAVILGDLARPDDAALVAQKILDRLAAPLYIQDQEVVVTASIGVATFPADGDNAETLLGAADAAMYRAKQSGRNAFQFFTADINQRTRARAQMGLELRRALERREFSLAYQPKIDLVSGNPCGAEALLRWKHPERGLVAPVEFIPVLEETGLIVPVGEWVLRRACEDLKEWQRQGGPAMPVAVNLSARQFRQHDLEDRIRAIVTAAGVDPSLIELEITESQLMHDPDHATRVLRALGAAGVRIAIDDFGTGYSSLAYLTRFPLASLKIDRSFVADVLDDEADATIVRTIVDMAHTLGFTVIAEGVELDSQAAFLRALGCEQAQGYLFARPMPAEDFSLLVTKLVAATATAAAAARPRRPGSKRRKSGSG